MGFLNKVKNFFFEFEEEIVEVDEEPKKGKKDEPVAKKIELPKTEKKDEDVEYTLDTEEIDLEKDNKFPMDFDEDDFKEETIEMEQVEEQTIKRDEPNYDFELEYGKEKERERLSEPHGLYEGKSAKKAFTPTPIISPIYGILDKNYKKDDVVTKKEIRLSSAPKKIDLDSVREKAYGDLTSDISQSMEEVKKKDYEEDIVDYNDDENLLYDLNDNDSPAVKKVTVGDAEEYFNELGLEYNVDYKDDSMEQTKSPKERTRRSTIDEEEIKKDTKLNDEIEKEDFDEESDDGLESNLFDLIESMYDEKE